MSKENLTIFLDFLETRYKISLSTDMIKYIQQLKLANLKINYVYLLDMFESEKMLSKIEKAHFIREQRNLTKLEGVDLVKYDLSIMLRKYPRYSKHKALKENPLYGITDEHKEVIANKKLYPELNIKNMEKIDKRVGYDEFLL